MKPRLLRKRYFVWTFIPATLFVLYLGYGLPHLRVTYSWIDQGQGHDPFAYRHYTHCVFAGPYGRFDLHPTDGACAWVRFYKRGEASRAG